MIENLFGNYYGLDWMAMLGSLAVIYLMGEKKRYGFLIGIVGNLAWIMVNFWANIWAGIILNIILIFLNIRGYIKWGKPEPVKEKA